MGFLVASIPEGFEPKALQEWSHSLRAALSIGIRQRLLMAGSEIELEAPVAGRTRNESPY